MEPTFGLVAFLAFLLLVGFLFIAEQRTLRISFCYLPAVICITGAVITIALGVTSGWGWLLFIGLLVFPSRDRLGRAGEE